MIRGSLCVEGEETIKRARERGKTQEKGGIQLFSTFARDLSAGGNAPGPGHRSVARNPDTRKRKKAPSGPTKEKSRREGKGGEEGETSYPFSTVLLNSE